VLAPSSSPAAARRWGSGGGGGARSRARVLVRRERGGTYSRGGRAGARVSVFVEDLSRSFEMGGQIWMTQVLGFVVWPAGVGSPFRPIGL